MRILSFFQWWGQITNITIFVRMILFWLIFTHWRKKYVHYRITIVNSFIKRLRILYVWKWIMLFICKKKYSRSITFWCWFQSLVHRLCRYPLSKRVAPLLPVGCPSLACRGRWLPPRPVLAHRARYKLLCQVQVIFRMLINYCSIELLWLFQIILPHEVSFRIFQDEKHSSYYVLVYFLLT